MSSNAKESLLSEVTVGRIQKEQSEQKNSEEEVEYTQCTWREFIYGAGDAVFGAIVVAPLTVGAWRGMLNLMAMNLQYFPYAQAYMLGICIHICFTLLRQLLLERSRGAWGEGAAAGRWLRERVLSRVYTYIFVLACNMHFHGGFGLFDETVATIIPDSKDPHRPVLIAVFLALVYIVLACLRASRNVLAPPFFVFTDGKQPTYIYDTRFRTNNSRETALYVLDCIFSVAVVGSLVVFVWRGSWALLDIYLYPDDIARSNWTSLIGGYIIVVVTFALQAPLRWATARLHGTPRLLLADLYHLMSFVATVNVWRGVWGLLDLYLFPETPKFSNWCSHIVSLGLLMLLNCSNSALVRGVYIDAEEPAGECVVFPCHYLRLFFHKERIKKRHRRALAAAAAAAAARNSQDASLAPLQMPLSEEKV